VCGLEAGTKFSSQIKFRTSGRFSGMSTPIVKDFADEAASNRERRRKLIDISALKPGKYWLDVIVNDAGPGRVRRGGQLVLSGGAGVFVYLQGDRHEPRVLVVVSPRGSS
jgi:hypothetical protein